MKWRLTGRYLASVVLIVILVTFINALMIIGLFIYQNSATNNPIREQDNSAEALTRSFEQQIVLSASGMDITAQGKDVLERNLAWLQVLDDNGNQVYGFHVPPEAKTKYTPMDIVQTYKYMEKELMSTVFVGEKQDNGKRYSYLIGFQNLDLERTILTYDTRKVRWLLQIGFLTVIGVDGIIALCIAYLFSKG